jgi:predicted alpha/beta superfamily hydrolase
MGGRRVFALQIAPQGAQPPETHNNERKKRTNEMGKITIYDDFYSPLDKFKRTVRVYTPDSYEENKDKRYPVIYMTDGQNVFEHPRSARRDTWRVNETLEAMWADGTLQREWIVCAIDHEIDRFGEYTPWYYPAASVYDPKGRKFLNNLTEFFIPWMNARYRTLEGPQNTALMGSSLGGLISLFCGRERPDVFGRIGAVSPSVMWADYRTFEHWNSKQEFWTKIYIDMGSENASWSRIFLWIMRQLWAIFIVICCRLDMPNMKFISMSIRAACIPSNAGRVVFRILSRHCSMMTEG